MLVLTRHVHQSIVIGHDVVVTVLEVRGDQVRLGITAPKDIQVHREEVFVALTAANRQAATSAADLDVLKELSGGPATARPPASTPPANTASPSNASGATAAAPPYRPRPAPRRPALRRPARPRRTPPAGAPPLHAAHRGKASAASARRHWQLGTGRQGASSWHPV